MNGPRIVCVLGMHRSGTSVVTRVLNLLGVFLGPEDRLIRPATDNPRGFWEHGPIMRLNQRILARLGGHGFKPPACVPGWERSAAFDPISGAGKTRAPA
jgi:hypothetical protein